MKKQGAVVAGLLVLGSVCVARADLTIEMKQNGEPMATYVKEHAIASEFAKGGMIFLGTEKVLRILDRDKKRYTEMTQADVEAMAAQMAEAQKALESLPAAMREKMQSAMKGAMGSANAKRTVRPLNEKKTINGFATEGYSVTVEGSADATEIWAANPSALKLAAKDFAVFKELAEFMKQMAPGLESMRDLIKDYEKPGPNDVPGFPVLSIHRNKEGKEVWRSELVRVGHEPVAPDKFEVPAGYKQEKMKLGE